MGTLTYAPPFCTDPGQLRRDLGAFFRTLRSSLGGKAFPYVWVPEYHADGERFHAHFALGRYVRVGLLRSAWGHGFVHIKMLSDMSVGSSALEEARHAAGYLSKYVSKSFLDSRIPYRHRYDVAQGFQPSRYQLWARSADEAIGLASWRSFDGVEPASSWYSADMEGWKGPPAFRVAWAG